MDKRIKPMNMELGLACLVVQYNLYCGIMNDVCTRVVRLLSPVHFRLVVSLVKIIIEGSFVPPLPFANPLKKLFVSAISRW